MSRHRLDRAFPLLAILAVAVPSGLTAQYSITAPSGRALEFSRDDLIRMNDTTAALQRNLEEDPEVLYFNGFGGAADETTADAVLPWNAVEVVTESRAAFETPGNLREADRAYESYAVIRMQAVRGDPDVSCDSIMALEVRAVEAFVDGWIVARTLFGGPDYAPLDELAFARSEGQLTALLADRGDRQLGGCLAIWRSENESAIAGYRRWRDSAFLEAAP